MLMIEFTSQFKKDYKLAIKRGFNPNDLQKVVTMLASGKQLPERYRDHTLINTNMRECHIKPDWLLV